MIFNDTLPLVLCISRFIDLSHAVFSEWFVSRVVSSDSSSQFVRLSVGV